MKRALQLLLILFLSISLNAQDYTLTPGQFLFELDGSKNEKIGYTLTNNTDSDLTWYWKLEKGEDFPEEWQVQLCDQILCWNPDLLQMPTDNGTNVLAASKSTSPELNYVQVLPNGKAGKGTVKLTIYDDEEFSNIIAETSFTTSVSEANGAIEVRIFPNPAQDFITVEGSDISRIDIHDIVGRKVKSFSYTKGSTHDISALRNGLYLVRIFDRQGKMSKSMRLSKR